MRRTVCLLLLAWSSASLCLPAHALTSKFVPAGLLALAVGGDVVATVGAGLTQNAVSQILGVVPNKCVANTTCSDNLQRVQANISELISPAHNVVAMGIVSGIVGLVYDLAHFTFVSWGLAGHSIFFYRMGDQLCCYAFGWGFFRFGLYGLSLASIFYGGTGCDEQCIATLPSEARDGINKLHVSRVLVALPGVVVSFVAAFTTFAVVVVVKK